MTGVKGDPTVINGTGSLHQYPWTARVLGHSMTRHRRLTQLPEPTGEGCGHKAGPEKPRCADTLNRPEPGA